MTSDAPMASALSAPFSRNKAELEQDPVGLVGEPNSPEPESTMGVTSVEKDESVATASVPDVLLVFSDVIFPTLGNPSHA